MKTDKEIFDDWCINRYGHPINVPGHIENELNTYGFLKYKLNVRLNEFINKVIPKLLKPFFKAVEEYEAMKKWDKSI